jgi:hypothetical protein
MPLQSDQVVLVVLVVLLMPQVKVLMVQIH